MSERSEWVLIIYLFIYLYFLQANLRTGVNYFSLIDQNNQINCLLHYHPCFIFEFQHSVVMISYQNSSSQCMNFKRRGLVWKSVATKVELDYHENHTLYLCCRSFLKNANWTWKLQWFYQIFRETSTIVIFLLPITSATSPSNYDV